MAHSGTALWVVNAQTVDLPGAFRLPSSTGLNQLGTVLVLKKKQTP